MSECERDPCVCDIVGRTMCIHEPTPEMVDAALNAWFASPPSETDQGLERSMRAALVAAMNHLPDLPQEALNRERVLEWLNRNCVLYSIEWPKGPPLSRPKHLPTTNQEK